MDRIADVNCTKPKYFSNFFPYFHPQNKKKSAVYLL